MNKRMLMSARAFAIMLVIIFTGCKNDDENVIPVDEIPSISSLSPEEGTVGTELSIVGTNFVSGATVLIGGIASNQVEVASATELFAIVPEGIAANTALDVKVRNTSGGEATLNAAFTAVEPVLSFINSATKPSGIIGSTVIIEGKAFGDLMGDGQVLFSDGAGGTVPASIANEDDWTNDFIVTTVPTGAGDGPVTVVTGIGTSNEMEFTIASGATFSPSEINWAKTQSLPSALSGHNALFVPVDNSAGETNNFVYVTGGNDLVGSNVDQVVYGQINADGTISAWNSAQALPAATAYHASVVATPFNSKVKGSGHIYVLGGTGADGEAVSSVSVAELNDDGSINSWEAGTSLPQPLHSFGAAIFRSTIYISGGATTGNETTAKVYKAAIDTLGQVGEWVELASLPSARAHHGFVSFGGYLYSVGGEEGAVAPESGTSQTNLSEVAYAKINLRNGDITDAGWTANASELQKSRSKHIALAAGGNLFVSSGLYAAASQGSSENIYAQINSDGTVGSFGGATGSNTLQSTGGYNLYNAAGISYVDATGAARVMVIGGKSVSTPEKTSNVLYY